MGNTVNAAIVGASGYTGDELIRVLSRHPRVSLTAVTSRQMAGRSLRSVVGSSAAAVDLQYEDLSPDVVGERADVFFLALPHGVAAEYAVPLLKAGKTVLDLSADFRLKDASQYLEFYSREHPAPELLGQSVYGNPELHGDELLGAQLIACPGCYPTSVLSALAPAIKAGLLLDEHLHIVSMSGVSGAGKKVASDYLFCECHENMRPYGVPRHRHIPEIEQELSLLAGKPLKVTFVPSLMPVSRGMLTIINAPLKDESLSDEKLQMIYREHYGESAFVEVLSEGCLPETGRTLRTNVCEVAVRKDARTGTLVAMAAQDNLGKGAAWQAVQAFNRCFDYPETTGLMA